ncbi:MAG: protocatechuate 3,4-dioxygenase [Planctomycetota bacterium]
MPDRRTFLSYSATTAAGLWVTPGAFAQRLEDAAKPAVLTPWATEGPFYPDELPLDVDNDLIVIGDATTPAVGEVVDLTGRVVSPAGEPVRNATVEIWQTDNNGVYLHSRSSGRRNYDSHFQGFGRFETAADGRFRFRTIKPRPYPGRTPHIHVAIERGGRRILTTQLYVKGEARNGRDFLYRRIRTEAERDNVTLDFVPTSGSEVPIWAAECELVVV